MNIRKAFVRLAASGTEIGLFATCTAGLLVAVPPMRIKVVH